MCKSRDSDVWAILQSDEGFWFASWKELCYTYGEVALMKLHCWWLTGFLCLDRTWRESELRSFSLYPREALLASGRIWFLEFSFAQIPYCVLYCQWDKRGGFEENGCHDSHMNNASRDRHGQSKDKYFKRKEKVNSVYLEQEDIWIWKILYHY